MNNPGMNNPAPTRRNCKTAVLSLLYGALLVTALVATACSNNTPPTPPGLQLKSTAEPAQIHFPGQTEQAKQLAQLRTEIREIQTTTAENSRNTPEPAPTQPKTPAVPVAATSSTRQPAAATATATATAPTKPQAPTATALPTPPRAVPTDNICRRNPGVQKALIDRLKISSCRIITNDELFRLDGDMTIRIYGSLAPGDLNGLVNLKSLEIEILTDEGENSKIPANTFSGMAKLSRLTISRSGKGNTTIEPGALNGLDKLETLSITGSVRLTISASPAEELGKLEYLSIQGQDITIPQDMFKKMPTLGRLQVKGNGVRFNESTFQQNPRLREIEIHSRNPSGMRTAFKDLTNLERLQIFTDGDNRPEIILSPKSPLMRDILNQERSPDGYTVVPPGGE